MPVYDIYSNRRTEREEDDAAVESAAECWVERRERSQYSRELELQDGESDIAEPRIQGGDGE